MELNNEVSENIHEMVYEICSRNDEAEKKEHSLNLLCQEYEMEKVMLSLFNLIMNEREILSVRKYASTYFVKCMERVNPLLCPMMRIFLTTMRIPEKRESMKKGLFQFVELITNAEHDPSRDYCQFLVNLMIKYLNAEDDSNLHELGAIMLHALLKNLNSQVMAHEKQIVQGLKIALHRGKCVLEDDTKSYILIFHALMCASILGHQISKTSLVLELFHQSLEILLDLLKHVAIYGTVEHFNEVSELLKVLLQDKKLSGKKFLRVVDMCHVICQDEQYRDMERVKVLEVLGSVISLRSVNFQKEKIFYRILTMLIEVLSQKPAYDLNEPLEQQAKRLPTSMSIAADILQFISKKYSVQKVSDSFVRILMSTIKNPVFNEWQFRGVLIGLGRIMKKCCSYLNAEYTKELTIAFQGGFIDSSIHVRQASVYALYKLFMCLPAECSCWVKQFFPSVLQSIELFISDCNVGNIHHPMHVERLFATMKIFCTIMDTSLTRYLPILTELCQGVLEQKKESRYVILTVELLQKIVFHTRVGFLPHFRTLIIKLEPFLTDWDTCDYDEVRPSIVSLFTNIMIYTAPDVMEIDGETIIELIFNMLKIQHARTQLHGANITFLLNYSPLRCSIFRFFQEISNIICQEMASYMPQLLGTLLGTINAIKCISPHDLDRIGLSQRKPKCENDTILLEANIASDFMVSDNNEMETAKIAMQQESYTLYDEVLLALVALQNIKSSCATVLEPYTEAIFSKLGQALRYSYGELRKQILYTLNGMLVSFLQDFPFTDTDFIQVCVVEMVDLLTVEADVIIIGESINGFLHYVAIKEKYFEPHINTHICFTNIMTEVFRRVTSLPNDGIQRKHKDSLLSHLIDFMSKLSMVSEPIHFSNYFGTFLSIFEAKITMPLIRSAISDQKRCEAYGKLIEGFHLMEPDNGENFKRISSLFIRGLNDPMNAARENAAAGLGMLVEHCDPQPVRLYKRIINALWKRSKREKNDGVMDCICFSMVLTINRNIWQLPIQKLLLKVIHLLPIRVISVYNTIMVEFFERVFLERPDDVAHVIKDIYKYLIELIKNDLETDVDQLFKRALSLAASLYSLHIDELRQTSINPATTQAILAVCKNRSCFNALLR